MNFARASAQIVVGDVGQFLDFPAKAFGQAGTDKHLKIVNDLKIFVKLYGSELDYLVYKSRLFRVVCRVPLKIKYNCCHINPLISRCFYGFRP